MNRLDTKIKLEIAGADIVIEDLDMAVEMKKTNEAPPNYCTVSIYNLSDDTTSKIKEFATGARVYYSNTKNSDGTESWDLVFEGTLRSSKKFKKPSTTKVSKYTKSGKLRKRRKARAKVRYNSPAVRTEFDETDVKTILELEDGKKAALIDAYFSKSYSGKFSNSQVIKDILNVLRANNVPIGRVDKLSEITYTNGKVFHGSAVSILCSLCSTASGQCFIKNGVLSIVTGRNSDSVLYGVRLDGTNCARPEEDTNQEVKVEAPLLPTLNPNDWVMLDFKNVSGPHKIYKLETKFDNFGKSGGTELTVKAK